MGPLPAGFARSLWLPVLLGNPSKKLPELLPHVAFAMKRVILTIRFELVQPGKETKNTSTSISIYFLQEFLVFFFLFFSMIPSL